jgi:hypothetical protein
MVGIQKLRNTANIGRFRENRRKKKDAKRRDVERTRIGPASRVLEFTVEALPRTHDSTVIFA